MTVRVDPTSGLLAKPSAPAAFPDDYLPMHARLHDEAGTGRSNTSLPNNYFDDGRGSEGLNASPERGGVKASASGLVSIETSVTVQRDESRLKRMKRSVITTARLHEEETQDGGFRWRPAMVTLTYRPDVDWRPKHCTYLICRVREWLKRRGYSLRYVWVMELTKAGTPHFHVLVWLPQGLTLPKPDKQGWWPHGFTRIETAKRAVGYLAKYASKGCRGESIPRGARLHGNGGLSTAGRQTRSWWMLPGWLREIWSEEQRPKRAPGGGWLSRLTGEWMPSRWRMISHSADWSAITFVQI